MADVSPPLGPGRLWLLRWFLTAAIAAAALAYLLPALQGFLAIVAVGAAVLGPWLRLMLVATTWRTKVDRPYVICAGVLVVAVGVTAAMQWLS